MVLSLIQCNKVSALYIIIFQWFYVSKTRKCSSIFLAVWTLQAHTCTQTFAGLALESALELADSSPDLANSTNNFVIVGRLPISNMFNISTPIQSADSSQPTIAGETSKFTSCSPHIQQPAAVNLYRKSYT